jgi:predicted transcriptional regulator
MGPHPILAALRERRKALRLSKQAVHIAARMHRATFDRREDSMRCATLEQIERWCEVLGYRLVLTKIDSEPIYWS